MTNSIHGGKGNDTISFRADGCKDEFGGILSINGGEGNDSIYFEDFSRSTVIIVGGKGNDTVRLSNGIYQYAAGDGDDTISDYISDTFETWSGGYSKISGGKIQITSGKYSTLESGDDVIIKVGDGSITVKDAKGKTLNIIGEQSTEPAGISIKGEVLTASKLFEGNSINLQDYDLTVTKVNASALSQSVSIRGNTLSNSIKGGSGDDTINGDWGNDTLFGGGGADIFIYEDGEDLIQDYKEGVDKIKLLSGSISGASLSSSNVILNITGGGKITVKGGKNKSITVIDGNGNETTNIYPLSTLPAGISVKSSVVTASTLFSGSKIDLADYENATKVNAAALSKNVNIVGTASNNSLKGGKGNDTLTGGAGNDVFIYEGGKDVITDYTAGQDKIKISSGKISKTTYSNKDVIFTIGDGTLTVKNGKGKNISVTDSSGSKIYSKTLDLLYDNNFISDEFALDSITEKEFEIENIETKNNLEIEQPVITYGEDK